MFLGFKKFIFRFVKINKLRLKELGLENRVREEIKEKNKLETKQSKIPGVGVEPTPFSLSTACLATAPGAHLC